MGSGSEAGRAELAVATCAELPGLDAEGRLLLEALRAAGVEAEPTVWDDPGVDWDRFAIVLLRSTWDYPAKVEGFLRWAGERGERLLNPLPAVEWNASKRYLKTLREWGFPTVETTLIEPGEEISLPVAGEFVVKPAISAGSVDTARYAPSERDSAHQHAASLLADGREVIVQPYLRSVEVEAETAVILLEGSVAHAMRKGPLLERGQGLEQGLFRPEQMEPREATPEQAELAEAVVARFAHEVCEPLYARVDLLSSDSGEPLILELELIEPSLFLDHHPPTLERLTGLVTARLEASGGG